MQRHGRLSRRAPIARRSAKGRKEAYQHRKLKKILLAEGTQDDSGNPLCWHCGGYPDWRGLEMVHLKYKSAGGKTEHDNCEIWCCPCHYGPDGHRIEILKEKI